MSHDLISFDPGGTTGWCRFHWSFGSRMRVLEFGQFPIRQIVRVAELICPEDLVVYEQIQVRHLGFDPIGLRVIGAIELMAAITGNEIVSQSPGNIRGAKIWPELADARKWFRKQPHAKDALYHGVTYLGLNHVDLTSRPQSPS